MSPEERWRLVSRNTQEILTEQELRDLLSKKKNPRGYIGLACTGRVHIGYFIPMTKVADFLRAGFDFTILLADLHAHLDDQKAPFEVLEYRVEYYQHVISAILESVGADTSRLHFVKGSDFQLQKEYTTDMYRMSAISTFKRCQRAASEVVRFGEDPKLSGFIYPILQALDEQYLNVDLQYGGIDQRKILAFARENLPKLGYLARVEVMTPMMPGLTGEKMSSSVEESKIDVLENAENMQKKVSKAFCPEGSVENNGVLAFLRSVVMVYKEERKEKFVVQRPQKFGGPMSFSTYAEIEAEYLAKKVHPLDLKGALSQELSILLEPVRKKMAEKEALLKLAYPVS